MDKNILEQYISAKELIDEYKGELERVKKLEIDIVSDTVTSSASFPFSPHQELIRGYDIKGEEKKREEIQRLVNLIQEQQELAIQLECEVFLFIQSIPREKMELKRICMLKYIEGLTWEQVADRVGMHRTNPEKVLSKYLRGLNKVSHNSHS